MVFSSSERNEGLWGGGVRLGVELVCPDDVTALPLALETPSSHANKHVSPYFRKLSPFQPLHSFTLLRSTNGWRVRGETQSRVCCNGKVISIRVTVTPLHHCWLVSSKSTTRCVLFQFKGSQRGNCVWRLFTRVNTREHELTHKVYKAAWQGAESISRACCSASSSDFCDKYRDGFTSANPAGITFPTILCYTQPCHTQNTTSPPCTGLLTHAWNTPISQFGPGLFHWTL